MVSLSCVSTMEQILESAKKKQQLKVVGVHDCVRIPVPHVDRAQTFNILGVVVDEDETSLYLVQTKQGVRTLGLRKNIVSIQDLPQKSTNRHLSVLEAATTASQGH